MSDENLTSERVRELADEMREAQRAESQMLRWKGTKLYAGRFYIGEVMRVVPEGWRDFSIYKAPPAADAPQYAKDNRVHMMAHHEQHDAKPWRGWLMFDEDGEPVGYWATEDEAKRETAKIAAIAIKV